MDIETFCREVMKCIQEITDRDTSIDMQKVYKNNGICLYSIVIRSGNEQCAPNIYMEDYFQQYKMGRMSLSQAAYEVVEQRERLKTEKIEPVTDFRWEVIKDKVFCRLVNRQRNRQKLETMPRMEYLDLAVTCRILHGSDGMGIASSEITYDEFDLLGVTEEELFRQAEQNTERLFPAEFKSLVSVIENMLGRQFESDEFVKMVPGSEEWRNKVNMYVLTNTAGINGAAVILYSGMLGQIAKQLKTDTLYLLPSSTHEFMVVPECGSIEDLKKMVTEANRIAVTGLEFLSDHVYRYDRKTNMVEIAG